VGKKGVREKLGFPEEKAQGPRGNFRGEKGKSRSVLLGFSRRMKDAKILVTKKEGKALPGG